MKLRIYKLSTFAFLLSCALTTLSALSPTQLFAGDIKSLQSFLTDKGCEPNGIDGSWGRGSRSAAKRYFEVSGVNIQPDTALYAWNEVYLAPSCEDHSNIAEPWGFPDYETPDSVIELSNSIVQFNWIPENLAQFDWQAENEGFFGNSLPLDRFSEGERSLLGCEEIASSFGDFEEWFRDLDTSFHNIFVNEQSPLNFSSSFLALAACTSESRALNAAMKILEKWSAEEAFLNFGFKSKRDEMHNKIGRNSKADNFVSQTIVYRESIVQFLFVWLAIKEKLDELPVEKVAIIESWLAQLVENQNYEYADGPTDCPAIARSSHSLGETERFGGDVRETCINTGLSRAGVSSLWALVSGEREFAVDALNTYFMALHTQRNDGSHGFESFRRGISHYKSLRTLAWMTLVTEAFATKGVDIYKYNVGKTDYLSAVQFLAESGFEPKLMTQYSRTPRSEKREFRDTLYWLTLNRSPGTDAAESILKHLAGHADRQAVYLKMFQIVEPGDRKDSHPRLYNSIIPFTLLYAPNDIVSLAPPDILKKMRNLPLPCPDMNWSPSDESLAGNWWFSWEILNVFDGKVHPGGTDEVVLKDGRGTIKVYSAYNPRREYRKKFDIAYGNGKICVSGRINLFDATPAYPMQFIGGVTRTLTKKWPDGDDIRLKLKKVN